VGGGARLSGEAIDLALALGDGGAAAERAYQALFERVTRDPASIVPALLNALDDLRPVAEDFPIGELRFSVGGAAISTPAVLAGERPRPLTVADLACVLVFNEARVDFGFRSDLAPAERGAAARRLRSWWKERR
jgi:hypothetical protein